MAQVNQTQNVKPEYELQLTIKWKPILGRKTIDAELGAVKAHILELLIEDHVEFSNITKRKLR